MNWILMPYRFYGNSSFIETCTAMSQSKANYNGMRKHKKAEHRYIDLMECFVRTYLFNINERCLRVSVY